MNDILFHEMFAMNKAEKLDREAEEAKAKAEELFRDFEKRRDLAAADSRQRMWVRLVLRDAFEGLERAAKSGENLPYIHKIPKMRRKWFRRLPCPFKPFDDRYAINYHGHPFNDEWMVFEERCANQGLQTYVSMSRTGHEIRVFGDNGKI